MHASKFEGSSATEFTEVIQQEFWWTIFMTDTDFGGNWLFKVGPVLVQDVEWSSGKRYRMCKKFLTSSVKAVTV